MDGEGGVGGDGVFVGNGVFVGSGVGPVGGEVGLGKPVVVGGSGGEVVMFCCPNLLTNSCSMAGKSIFGGHAGMDERNNNLSGVNLTCYMLIHTLLFTLMIGPCFLVDVAIHSRKISDSDESLCGRYM